MERLLSESVYVRLNFEFEVICLSSIIVEMKMLLPKVELLDSMPPSPSDSSFSSSLSFTDDSEMREAPRPDYRKVRREDYESKASKKKRIRQNLNHLSNEEKLNRRKMKNRVAAQSARDRKKVKMDILEAKVAKLSEERTKLAKENERLRKQGTKLVDENAELKERLCSLNEQPDTSNLDLIVKKEPVDISLTLKSAALINASQQQKQGKVNCRTVPNCPQIEAEEEACPWMMPFVCWLVAIESLMRSSTGWKAALTNFLKENLKRIPTEVVEMIIKLVQDKELSEEEDSEELLQQLPPEIRNSLQLWTT